MGFCCCRNPVLKMFVLPKIPRRTHDPQSAFRFISASFFSTHSPNAVSHHDTFPDQPTCAYYDDQVNRAGGAGDFETIRRLLNKRFWDGCFNTNETFKFVNNTDSSLSTLDDLFRTLARLDSGPPRKLACDRLVARLCKIGRVDEALRLVDEMACGGYGLDASTFYPVLSELTRKKSMEEAWRVADLMRSHALMPDLTAYNYFLTAYCYKGDLESASNVLKRIEEEGLSPDSRAYDALVLGACRAGKVEGAMVMLRKMEDDGIPVLYSTHAHVISALVRRGYFAQSVRFVRAYSGRDEKLETESFGVLASKLIKRKKHKEAKSVLEEMVGKGLRMGDNLLKLYEAQVKGKEDKNSSVRLR